MVADRHRLRLATYNVCWFAGLFDDQNRLLADGERSAMHDVPRHRQASAIAEVLGAVDADLFAIIEAPNTGRMHDCVAALEGFAETFGLRQRKVLTGFISETDQEIALLYDPDRVSARHDPRGELLTEDAARHADDPAGLPAPRFDGVYALDLDGDGEIDVHRFSKPPLEASVKVLGSGAELRLVAVHAKSKAPYGADSPEDAARIALLNRQKQLAQCAWLRARIDEHLGNGEDLVALGDFNDGPGLDKYERVFGRSGVEVVLGNPADPDRLLHTPFTKQPLKAYGSRPSTARFYSREKEGFMNALIDFVMLSPCLAERTAPAWRIWHPFDDAACFENESLRQALLDASDHFPVSVDLTLA